MNGWDIVITSCVATLMFLTGRYAAPSAKMVLEFGGRIISDALDAEWSKGVKDEQSFCSEECPYCATCDAYHENDGRHSEATIAIDSSEEPQRNWETAVLHVVHEPSYQAAVEAGQFAHSQAEQFYFAPAETKDDLIPTITDWDEAQRAWRRENSGPYVALSPEALDEAHSHIGSWDEVAAKKGTVVPPVEVPAGSVHIVADQPKRQRFESAPRTPQFAEAIMQDLDAAYADHMVAAVFGPGEPSDWLREHLSASRGAALRTRTEQSEWALGFHERTDAAADQMLEDARIDSLVASLDDAHITLTGDLR